MAAVGTRDTAAEVTLRKTLHRLDYRYRIAPESLPGKPDLVFPGRRKVVFVHGCFWHGHACRYGKLPKSRLEYWRPKIDANRIRDRRQRRKLRRLGWPSAVVWECSLKRNLNNEVARIVRFLEKDGRHNSVN
jgi:DNA mismatch endonuclease (patch repair protein)